MIIFIYRKSKLGFHSIESLFNNIQTYVSVELTTKQVFMPHQGASPIVLLKNLLSWINEDNAVYHITGDVHYMALAMKKNVILTIHDIQSAVSGNLIKRIYIKMFWFWLPALFVKHITVISEFTKRELEKVIPIFKNKITVIPNPVSSSFKYSEYEFNKKQPVILCVGTKANKNLERVIEAIKHIECKLVIIGILTDRQLELLKIYKIHYLNVYNLTQDELVKVYEDSDLLCFPSTYEGFGMPIIEAQAVGRPVITSNLGAMLEVAGDSACLVDPYDINDITKAIEKLINEDTYRNSIIKKGLKNTLRFQLSIVGRQYISLYNNAKAK